MCQPVTWSKPINQGLQSWNTKGCNVYNTNHFFGKPRVYQKNINQFLEYLRKHCNSGQGRSKGFSPKVFPTATWLWQPPIDQLNTNRIPNLVPRRALYNTFQTPAPQGKFDSQVYWGTIACNPKRQVQLKGHAGEWVPVQTPKEFHGISPILDCAKITSKRIVLPTHLQ